MSIISFFKKKEIKREEGKVYCRDCEYWHSRDIFCFAIRNPYSGRVINLVYKNANDKGDCKYYVNR